MSGSSHPGFIYLASAYTKHPAGHEAAFRAACHAASAVIQSGFPVFSPVAHSHPLSVHGAVGADEHELWMQMDAPMLEAASELWVLCDTHGAWERSEGVRQEVRQARTACQPVQYLIPCAREHMSRPQLVGYRIQQLRPSTALHTAA